MIKYNTERYVITEKNGKLYGQEKEHRILKEDKRVLVHKLTKNLGKSVSNAFDKINAESVIKKGDIVAIKVNLGGGIHYVPWTYSDPKICEAIIEKVKKMGATPFICEADIRSREMTENFYKIRGYWDLIKRQNIKFYNLSKCSTVQMTCFDLDIPLKLPEILLHPRVKIISFAPPKHHWECGITCNQKNMYGAIAEPRKSIYHRKYDRLERAVAAAARIMSPDINILATFAFGAGMGPHFCIPIRFNRMIISKDMIRGDKVASKILDYPFRLVKYALINTKGKNFSYLLHPASNWPSEETLKLIKKHSINFKSVNFWKPALYVQYFVPHLFQLKGYAHFEFIFTWFNKVFVQKQKVLLKMKRK